MDTGQFQLATAPGSGIRASDADRERMSEVLRRHHLEGRLDTSEFQERLERCLQAKTLGELGALSVDLPSDPERASRVRGVHPARAWRLTVAAIVLTALIVGSALAERPLFFPAVPVLFFLFRASWSRDRRYRSTAFGGQGSRWLR